MMISAREDKALWECVQASRRLGGDAFLVLHGGGNTSVKSTRVDVMGREVDVLFVKGSGYDLATIVPEGFAPLRLERVLDLAALPSLDDLSLVNELQQASLDAHAPSASIESVLHALIPHRFVMHTHADAIVTLTNQTDGERLVHDAMGDDVLVLPYRKPGFELARQVAEALKVVEVRGLRGIVLRNHGLFTFSDSADEAVQTHLSLVGRAESHLPYIERAPQGCTAIDAVAYATLRRDWSRLAGRPLVLERRVGTMADSLIEHDNFAEMASQGPLTPEHVIHTKRLPMLGENFDAYADAYTRYVEEHRENVGGNLVPIDPAPRVMLDKVYKLVSAGITPKSASVAGDIAEHTALGILRAEKMTGFRTLSSREVFDIEYWDLEQRKLAKREAKAFSGEVALVTGAASGIGQACAIALEQEGAAVIALDRDPKVQESDSATWHGVVCDVTNLEAMKQAIADGVLKFGGIDIVVPAAGVFAASHPIAGFPSKSWVTSIDVNVTGLLNLLSEVHPFLARAPRYGRVVLVGSKNVPAPGPGAAAYSASKAAANQLARVAALEWADDGIRVNMVNPDAVFDTGLWSPELLEQRAAKYRISVGEYKRRNLLSTEIASVDVGRLVAAMCGSLFSATTGVQVPIDGGSDRII